MRVCVCFSTLIALHRSLSLLHCHVINQVEDLMTIMPPSPTSVRLPEVAVIGLVILVHRHPLPKIHPQHAARPRPRFPTLRRQRERRPNHTARPRPRPTALAWLTGTGGLGGARDAAPIVHHACTMRQHHKIAV